MYGLIVKLTVARSLRETMVANFGKGRGHMPLWRVGLVGIREC